MSVFSLQDVTDNAPNTKPQREKPENQPPEVTDAANNVKAGAIFELKSMKNPPVSIIQLMEAVCITLAKPK